MGGPRGRVAAIAIAIVGAGSAGATLAGRLTDRPDTDVVLFEAGPAQRSDEVDERMRSPNPGRALQSSSPFTWSGLEATRTAVQPPYRYWRGRGLGGTSAINGQIATRPGPEAFDRWPRGWQWEDVLPSFVRLEDDPEFGLDPYHGVGGPIPIHRAALETWEPIDLALRSAALAAGHPECPDPQRTDRHGCVALRHQQPRREARFDQPRLPRANPTARQISAHLFVGHPGAVDADRGPREGRRARPVAARRVRRMATTPRQHRAAQLMGIDHFA